MGGFFSALLGGQDKNLNNLISQYGQIGGQQTGQGQKYENQAGDFFSSLVSGDAGKISQTLAPQISAAAGAASALPSAPLGYLEMSVNSVIVKVPFFAV